MNATTKPPGCAACKNGQSPETTALTWQTDPRCRYCGRTFVGRYQTIAQSVVATRMLRAAVEAR